MIGLEKTQEVLPWTHRGPGGRIKGLIQERCGLYFRDHELKNLEQAVSSRMQSSGIGSVGQYIECLACPDGREFTELLNLLTIRHTYFFRDKAHFSALAERILPRLLDTPRRSAGYRKPELRIWSAGCSTGEEPYSIAMVVADGLPAWRQWDIQILATDVSTQALEVGRRGIYGERSIKKVDPEQQRRYFTERSDPQKGRTYQVREDLRALVRFDRQSLLEGTLPDGLDVIFCRNVMIYFDRPTAKTLIAHLRDSLVDDGCLFVGPCEGLLDPAAGLRLIEHQDGVYYRKAPRGSALTVVPDLPQGHSTAEGDPIESRTEDLTEIEQAVGDKDYERALVLIESLRRGLPNGIESFYWAAHVYANQGNYDRAREKLDRLVQINAFFAPAYHLRGTIHLQQQDLDQAKADLKKAIFLDQAFSMAYLTLAVVYQEEGKAAEAVRQYRNAAGLLSDGPAEEEVPYSGGFTRATLAAVCLEAVERMEGNP